MWITINPSTFAMKKVSLVDKMSLQGPTSIPPLFMQIVSI